MTMPTVAQAQEVYETFAALTLDASEEVDRIRLQVAMGTAKEAALTKALKAEQVAIQRRKTAEAGLQACKLAERAAAEAERQAVARATAGLKREALAKLGTLNVQTLAVLTEALGALDSLGQEYIRVRGLIGREAGAFPLDWPHMQAAMAGMSRTIEVLDFTTSHTNQQTGEAPK